MPGKEAAAAAGAAGGRDQDKLPGMKVLLDELPVFFPYDYMYKEQFEYMLEIKRTYDEGYDRRGGPNPGGHAVLEMPSGTGKTVCILAVTIAYQKTYPDRINKLIYCTRTVPEIEKALTEMNRLIRHLEAHTGKCFNARARVFVCVCVCVCVCVMVPTCAPLCRRQATQFGSSCPIWSL